LSFNFRWIFVSSVGKITKTNTWTTVFQHFTFLTGAG